MVDGAWPSDHWDRYRIDVLVIWNLFFLVRENKCQLYVNLFPWSCSLQEGTTALVAGAERRFISGRYEGVGVLGVKSFLPIVGAQGF